MAKIDVVKTEFGCLEVPNVQGKPVIRVGKKVMKVARFIYEECFGEIPEGKTVRHTCDNAYCVNPEHLALGTKEDNHKDMLFKREMNRAKKNPPNDGEERLMNFLYEKEGYSIQEISRMLHYPQFTVWLALGKPER